MLYDGKVIQLKTLSDGLVEFHFNMQDESTNKFNVHAMSELERVLGLLENNTDIKGMLITSGKKDFIVGADIEEFGSLFNQENTALTDYLAYTNKLFSRIEDLNIPTVAAIEGYALGAGLEFCLCCDYRIVSTDAIIGLPEVNIGLIPGLGGVIRLSRIAGLDVAIEWITSGKHKEASEARRSGVVDDVVDTQELRSSSRDVLCRAINGNLPIDTRKQQKKAALQHNSTELVMSLDASKVFVSNRVGKNYPAPIAAIDIIQKTASLNRDDAIIIESEIFTHLAKNSVTQALVGIFVNDQKLGKKAKMWEAKANKLINQAAVLGAGIMGAGIAYQSALKGVPIKMKDIQQCSIDLGLSKFAELLSNKVKRGDITPEKMAKILNAIDPCLSYDTFDRVDIVIEAVIENAKVKRMVLAEVEDVINPDTILCSSTSTIPISHLAQVLKRPENFCGMHFFNPVHAMALVEIIRGEKTSDKAIARTVAYANTLGKKAVVVNDCPGFLINRLVSAYFSGFLMLLRDGANFQVVDKVMEMWGWPMGPAYLMDVVGIDTVVNTGKVIAEGFPERMEHSFQTASNILSGQGRLGQKNGKGFYNYEPNKKGKLQKILTDTPYELLKPYVAQTKTFDNNEIIHRMVLPMATEMARCYEEGVVASVEEADMALIYGLGFPPFRGGIFRWIDTIGISQCLTELERYQHLGSLYAITESMKANEHSGTTYYGLA